VITVPRKLWWILAAALAGLLTIFAGESIGQETDSSDAAESFWRTAGGATGVWVARAEGESVRLTLAEIDEEKAGLRRVMMLWELPHLMVPTDAGPLLVFEARGEGPQRMYPIRRGDFEDRAGLAISGSLVAISPLVTPDRVVSGVGAGGRIYLLASSVREHQGAVLYAFENHSWESIRLPVELSDASLDPADLRVLALDGQLGVLIDGPSDESSVLWTLGKIDFDKDPGPEGYFSQWESTELPIGLRGRKAIAAGMGDEAVVVAEADGGVECLLLRRQGAIRFAWLEGQSMPEAVVAQQDHLWLLTGSEEESIAAVVVDRDGAVVAQGELVDAPRRAGEDGVLFLLLVAWSVVISALILMMQQGRQLRIVIPPEGYALAEPSRRLFAALIDLLPGMAMVSLLWDKPLGWWLSPLSEIVAADGSMPVFALVCLTFIYMTLADGLTGRTIGRALTGCRVMTDDGEVPGLRRAAARSFLKVFCPPLVVVLLLMPFVPAPWSFGTVVVKKVVKDRGED